MPRSSPRSPNLRISVIPILAGIAIVLGSSLFLLRGGSRARRGDEGTYVAMAASLARDFDLEFGVPDVVWAESHAGGPVALILQRARGAAGSNGAETEVGPLRPRGRIAYSKPILFPLLAAPFVALVGEWGGVVLNLLALLVALALARAYLEQSGDLLAARDTLLTFVASGVVLSYVAWRMTETLQVALALAGLVLTFAASRSGSGSGEGASRVAGSLPPPSGRWAARRLASPNADLVGGALLGLLVSLREPNALVAGVPVLAALLSRDARRTLRITGAILAAYAGILALTWAATGEVNPYKSIRATFNVETGYPAGERGAAPAARFDSPDELATSSLALAPLFDGERTAYAAVYFLVGRHTGLLIYLPAALLFALAALRRSRSGGEGGDSHPLVDRPQRVAALLGFLSLALFYLVWMPANFFGGETFVGNRYILAAYPCLLVALRRLPSRRLLLAVWALAALAGGSALASEIYYRALDPTSQSHANAGIFRWMPYESTASNLDGRRDRYWSGDFVRFVDPFASPETSSFTIASDGPAAEVEIATRFPDRPMNLVAVADAADATLAISDWRGTRRYPLAHSDLGRASGCIVHVAAPAWRRHRFWWSPEARYDVRLVRFAVETKSSAGATLRLRYLGRNSPQLDGFAREAEPIELPGSVVAGTRSEVNVSVRNSGTWTWDPGAVTPVQLALRVSPMTPGGAPASEPRFALPQAIGAGETLQSTIAVSWPDVPGRYRVSIDLVVEDLAWFGDVLGAPLASAEVEVRAK
ncbi:MAG: hypothetical protein ABI639_00630 [Thermoanaerobaculia bacterium]